MALYREKATVVEAFQLGAEWPDWWGKLVASRMVTSRNDDGGILLQTPKGWVPVDPGDWVVRSLFGEVYPCRGDMFAASYDPA